MKEIQYLDILKKSFLISWKNKFLWFFGFFIFFNLVLDEFISFSDSTSFKNSTISSLSSKEANLYLALLLLIIVSFGVLKVLSVVGLIQSINNPTLYKQKKIKAILFGATKYFWRLLGIDLALDLFIFFVSLFLAFPVTALFALNARLFGILTLIAASFILIPLILLAFFLKKFAHIFMVLSDSNAKASLDFSYTILLKHKRASLLMFFIMLLNLIIFLSCIFGLFLVYFVVVIICSFLFASAGGWLALSFLGSMLVILLVVASSFFNVYTQKAWFLFFSQISMQKNEKKALRQEKVLEDNEVPNPEAA